MTIEEPEKRPTVSQKVAVVTGANGGLGFQMAVELARRGMRVVMACRNLDKARSAQRELLAEVPDAAATVAPLDVSEPESIQEFGRRLPTEVGPLDLLVNNAGVVLVPMGRNSVGQELHLATNHLGPFALTGTLLPLLREAPGARVVNVGSLAHRLATLDLDDLNWEKTPYSEWKAYGRSKVAMVSFTLELDRRLRETGSPIVSVGAHPGFARTNAGRDVDSLMGKSALSRWWVERVMEPLIPRASAAVQPIVHAATAEGVQGGDYYGPTRFLETRGRTGRARVNSAAKDIEIGRRLWSICEEMTGVEYLSSL